MTGEQRGRKVEILGAMEKIPDSPLSTSVKPENSRGTGVERLSEAAWKERAWLIWFEDFNVEPEVFLGAGAESSARLRFADITNGHNATLFRSVDTTDATGGQS